MLIIFKYCCVVFIMLTNQIGRRLTKMHNQDLPKNALVLNEMVITKNSSITSSSQRNGISFQRMKKLFQRYSHC
jgi:hypothetical protein